MEILSKELFTLNTRMCTNYYFKFFGHIIIHNNSMYITMEYSHLTPKRKQWTKFDYDTLFLFLNFSCRADVSTNVPL